MNKSGAITRTPEVERLLLELHKQGLSTKSIARKLNVSAASVSNYIKTRGLKLNFEPSKSLFIIDSKYGKCSRCDKVETLKNWPKMKGKNGKLYFYSYCRQCWLNRHLKYVNRNVESQLLNKYKMKYTIHETISFERFCEMWYEQKGKCFYTDVELDIEGGTGKKPNSLSVDRLDPRAGYFSENCVLAANRINCMKGDATLEEMKHWMPLWYERILFHFWDSPFYLNNEYME